jgi:hypothetical protein
LELKEFILGSKERNNFLSKILLSKVKGGKIELLVFAGYKSIVLFALLKAKTHCPVSLSKLVKPRSKEKCFLRP